MTLDLKVVYPEAHMWAAVRQVSKQENQLSVEVWRWNSRTTAEGAFLPPIRAVVYGLICLGGSAWVTPAAAQNPNNAINDTRYLALGDSVPFGYNPTVPIDLENYHGYPEFVSDGARLKVANASCFGESSGSFLSPSAPDLGCKAWKKSGFPLWVPYKGTQMDYAVKYLSQNPNAKLVTINIGGNDLGILQQTCAMDVTCELAGLPGVLAAYGNNLFTIFSRIRVDAGYQGPIIVLTYYAFNYNDPLEVGALTALNGITSGTATAFGATIADGFTAFMVAATPFGGDSCAAGLLVRLPSDTCDTHPSIAGQRLLADAVLKVVSLH